MANTDNKCSDLPVEDFYTGAQDTLGLIYNKQKELQERYGFDFKDWTIKQIADFWMVNKHALGDELNEMFDALGYKVLETNGLKPTPSVGFLIFNLLTFGSIQDCKFIQYVFVVKVK